ncbi:MAG: M48 family peptidase [Acidobacteria bacterium]|nr:M48 family peptidase [Acidobacteriota bacterium]
MRRTVQHDNRIASTAKQLEFNFEYPSAVPEPASIEGVYREAFEYYDRDRSAPPITISFYPYIGINHTIRIRDGKVFVRLAEVCRDMPESAHRGLAYILVGKLRRKAIPEQADRMYAAYADRPDLRERAAADKRARGRKVVTTTKGAYYDLDEIFDEVNQQYFLGSIPKPSLTWSAKKTYRILGHHDATHDHVTISRSLDSRIVPRFIVEYVLFHEMLHIAHPIRHVNGRRHSHTAAFKRDEKKFARYGEAEGWIQNNVHRLKRASKRK